MAHLDFVLYYVIQYYILFFEVNASLSGLFLTLGNGGLFSVMLVLYLSEAVLGYVWMLVADSDKYGKAAVGRPD